MKILEIRSLIIPAVKVIRFGRFRDHRGYFTEHFRKSAFMIELPCMRGVEFKQCNESYSRPGTIRGLHFQWNPHMGKLVRTLSGRMTDLALDIRKGSPTFGKILAYDMPADPGTDCGEWIWVPPGFAHGNYFAESAHIEYFCSEEYSPGSEAGISPFAPDIDWSLCDPQLRLGFNSVAAGSPLMTDKDRNGYSLASWCENPDSGQFVFAGQNGDANETLC